MTSPGRTLAHFATVAAAGSVVVQYGFHIPADLRWWLARADLVLATGFALDLAVVAARTGAPLAAIAARRFEWLLLALLLLAIAMEPVREFLARLGAPWGADSGRAVALHLFLVGSATLRLFRLQEGVLEWRLRSGLILPLSFGALIAAGTLLLCFPRASGDPARPFDVLDALFTATSAACVTGLVVRDIGTDLSPFGRAVVLGLMQLGGLGIITFVATLNVLSGRSLSIPQMRAVGELVASRATLGSLRTEIRTIALWALSIELAGAALLFVAWPHPGPLEARIGTSVFHAVSAFCNAGLTLTSDSLTGLAERPAVLATIGGLLVVGGLGFPVVADLGRAATARLRGHRPRRRLGVHSRLALVTTAALLAGGALVFWLSERHGVLASRSSDTRAAIALFESATARTAGFSTVEAGDLRPPTLVLLMVLMVIGAGPVSTGGGVKTVTFAVLLLTLRTMIAGRERVEVWGRTLAWRAVRAAISVFVIYMLAVVAVVWGLAALEPGLPLSELSFEGVSALGTVGLSTGITPRLGPGAQLLLCVAMFAGRVGPLTLFVVMLGRRPRAAAYEYPEEDVVVG